MKFLRHTIVIFFCASIHAFAENPMVTDDAGTLDKGGKKIEGGFTKVSSERGGGLGFGFAPTEDVELGLTYQRLRDSSIPATANIAGVSAKWIPFKSGVMTAGLKVEHARARASGGGDADATTAWALTTWRFQGGYVLHANLGRSFTPGSDTNKIAIGGELPVREGVQITGDVYRATGATDTGLQLGVRWEVQKGLKLSAAAGRAEKENTLFAGFSWEF
jgi:hypothetical protein